MTTMLTPEQENSDAYASNFFSDDHSKAVPLFQFFVRAWVVSLVKFVLSLFAISPSFGTSVRLFLVYIVTYIL